MPSPSWKPFSLIYYTKLIKDGTASIQKAAEIRDQIFKFQNLKSSKDAEWIRFDTYKLSIDGEWTLLWASSATSAADVLTEDKMLIKEVERVETNVTAKTDAIILTEEDEGKLEVVAQSSVLEVYREYLYFVFSFIAFYG